MKVGFCKVDDLIGVKFLKRFGMFVMLSFGFCDVVVVGVGFNIRDGREFICFI